MKHKEKTIAIIILVVLTMLFLTSCNTNSDTIIFNRKSVVNKNFSGIGIEWDVYENPYLVEEQWESILNRMDNLNPAIVRCMFNMDWYMFVDIMNDNEIIYNFNGAHLQNLYKILDYCEENGIIVALGAWDYPKGFFMEESGGIASPLWAEAYAKMFEELITNKKYTCIKYAIPANEPNLWQLGEEEPYNVWIVALKNLHKELSNLGLLGNLTIAGPDTTGIDGSVDWVSNLEQDKELRSLLSIYEVHGYIPDYYILTGMLAEELMEFTKSKRLSKSLHMWEAGLFDGKTAANNQMRIHSHEYGVVMTDYTIQTLMAGFSSVVYWQFDDAMHFNAEGGTFLWGMFNSIGTAEEYQLRPWYHAMSLFTRCIQKDMTIMSGGLTDENFRAIAGVSKDKTKASIIGVNEGEQETTKTFKINGTLKAGKDVYVYVFNENDLKLDSNGYVMPNKVFNGVALNKNISITIPPKSAIFITTEKLESQVGDAS